jgi:hypothetical protein
MDLIRSAEQLWFEWSGSGYEPSAYKSVSYFTYSHVSLEHPTVVGGLASALQRDGIVDSLSEGKKSIEMASFFAHGYAGTVDDDVDVCICDEQGYTFQGELVDKVENITIVEVVGLGE